MSNRLHYDAATLIKEYAQKVIIENNYKLTEEDISLICKYQFILTRRKIESGVLGVVRIKYFGSFRVFKGRAVGLLNRAKKLRANHRITEQDMERIELMVNQYLENEHDTSEKVD